MKVKKNNVLSRIFKDFILNVRILMKVYKQQSENLQKLCAEKNQGQLRPEEGYHLLFFYILKDKFFRVFLSNIS